MTRSLRRLLILVGGLCFYLFCDAARFQGVGAQNVADPRFGIVEAFWAPDEAAALGVGWERILFYWDQLQPYSPNDWNTLHVRDEWLAEANAHSRTVVGLLKNTPAWATDGPVASGVPRGLYLPLDDPGNLWANFTRRVAGFYGQRGVHHWIIWNEPDIAPEVYGHEFGGSMEDYYQLLKVAYLVIKEVDPAATIHLGGMTYWHDPGYLRRFLRLVAADPSAEANNFYFDVISLHIYFRPETVSTIVGAAFATQQEVGIAPLKPVWINETNARPSMDPQWPVQVQAFHIDLEQQAWFITQAYALGFYAGAARISVYKLVDVQMSPGDESWGLVRPYDFSKRPAYFAYQNIIKYLSGFTYPLQRERAEGYYIVSFPRPQGMTRVLWARTTNPVSLRVPALTTSAQLIDAVTDTRTSIVPIGGVYTINLQGARCHVECLIGGPPLLLVEEGEFADVVSTAAPLPPPPAVQSSTTPALTPTPADTLTPTPTQTGTPTASPTQSPPPVPSNTATSLPPSPSPTSTATQTPASTNTAVPAEIAAQATVPQATRIPDMGPSPSGSEEPQLVQPTSWWFLGAGAGLGIFLLILMSRRQRDTDHAPGGKEKERAG